MSVPARDTIHIVTNGIHTIIRNALDLKFSANIKVKSKIFMFKLKKVTSMSDVLAAEFSRSFCFAPYISGCCPQYGYPFFFIKGFAELQLNETIV